MTDWVFSNEDLNFISDKTIFERKAAINIRIADQLNELHKTLNMLLHANREWLPENVLHSVPKISRGENYNGFPWLVLDYPRLFSSEEVFAFRTLFWWGHSWVLAFQVSGSLFQHFYSSILANLPDFSDPGSKIGIGTDPWVHNPDDTMYVDLKKWLEEENAPFEKIKFQPFFKLVKKIEFRQSEKLAEEALGFYGSCLRLFKS